jgi:hypothetical protein
LAGGASGRKCGAERSKEASATREPKSAATAAAAAHPPPARSAHDAAAPPPQAAPLLLPYPDLFASADRRYGAAAQAAAASAAYRLRRLRFNALRACPSPAAAAAAAAGGGGGGPAAALVGMRWMAGALRYGPPVITDCRVITNLAGHH